MTSRKNILTTTTIVMVCLAAVVTVTASYVAYDGALAQRHADLEAIARREAQVIDAILRHGSADHGLDDHAQPADVMNCPRCATAVTLVKNVLSQSGNLKSGQGRGVEFVGGSRDGDDVRFLLQRDAPAKAPGGALPSVPWGPDLAEPMRRALSGRSGTMEVRQQRGETVLASYAPVGPLGWGVVARIDMTEMREPFVRSAQNILVISGLAILVGMIVLRRRLEPLIQKSHDSERQALTALQSQKRALDEHAIVAATDPSGKITYANEKFCQISQYTKEELLGQDHRILNSGYHPRTFFVSLWKTISAGDVWHGDVCNRAKDGSLYWVDTTIVPFKDDAGRITQHVAIRADITERIKMEAALNESAAQAEAANLAKSEFLANMSHEIRTPMTAILGFAENLLVPDQSPSDRLDCVQTVRRNGEHLIGIINDILDLSKIESGKSMIELQTVEPCRIIAEAADLMHVRADASGLKFEVGYVGAIPQTIHSDPTRLRQILINLIGNAIKFTHSGTVRLVTRFVDDADGTRLQFDVTDTGCGMSRSQVAKLFQPFVQADTSTTRKFGGTGLGLTISKRFAELLGGTIAVTESKLGVGSTFRATVSTGPITGVTMLDDPRAATIVADGPITVAPVGPKDLQDLRILLAEDGLDNQRLFTHILRRSGADVTVRENGQCALDAVLAAWDAGQPFDVILMDMQMPLMDGYTATRALREAGYHGPIVALTANAMTGDREKCLAVGCDDYATKPIDRGRLIKTIQRQVAKAPARLPLPT